MDETNIGNAVDVNEQEEVATMLDKPYGKLELVNFGKNSKLVGFSFWQKVYKSSTDAINHISSLGKNGEEVVTALINAAISAATRTKATMSAPEGDDDAATKVLLAAALTEGKTVLLTEEEAEKYIPGSRERYGLGYFQRAFLKARKELMDAKGTPTFETAKVAYLAAKAALDKAVQEDEEASLFAAVEAEAAPATN
jgi:hypothetical protein